MIARQSKIGSLAVLKSKGLCPGTVIDVGAQYGESWYGLFAGSRFVLVEPIAECGDRLRAVCETIGNAEYVAAAALDFDGECDLAVRADRQGSSASLAGAPGADGRERRKVPAIRLDTLVKRLGLAGPYVIKIDVDGIEPRVIDGASGILPGTECVIVEATLYSHFHHVIGLMEGYGFAVWDVVDALYRPRDKALWQVDLVFVGVNSRYREGGWESRQGFGAYDPSCFERLGSVGR